MSRRLLPALVAGAALTLTSCATSTISAEEVAEAAEDALEREVGARPEVACPDQLVEEEGATTRCTLTAPDDPTEYGVTVTVTRTDGDTRIGVRVDDEPLTEQAAG